MYDIDWAPFEWRNEVNRHTGIIADILNLIEKKSGIKFEAIHTNSWATAVLLAQNHKVDMYSAVPFDTKRAKYMNFTTNDIFVYNACFVKNIDKKIDFNNLSSKTIAIVKSSSLGNFIKEKYPEAKYIEVTKTKDGFKELQEKKVDLFAINSATADYTINTKGFIDLTIAKKLDYKFELKIAISKSMPKEVLTIIDKTLGSIDNQEIDNIYNKWMKPIVIQKEINWTIIIYILIFVIGIILFFLYKQQQMKKSIDEFSELIDATMEGILVFKDKVCIDVNQSTVDIFRYDSKDELIGKSALSFVAEVSHDIVKQHIDKDDVKPYEATMVKKDGTEFYALIRGKNIKNKTIRISSVIDITEMKKRDNLLIQQSRLAAMGEMIGNIAHQWRQPLSLISTSATGMLVEHEFGLLDDKHLEEKCENINKTAQYLSKTIDDFRNFIKGNREQSVFKLEKSINEFLSLTKGTIKNHNINVITTLDSSLEIYGYENELIQCYMNIFNNAKDALDENQVEEKLIFIDLYKDNNKNILEFKDNAGGIPQQILHKIFEPYFTTKHKSQGTGLGLHMSYNLIVNGMNGELKAYNTIYNYNNKEYKGACFRIVLFDH